VRLRINCLTEEGDIIVEGKRFNYSIIIKSETESFTISMGIKTRMYAIRKARKLRRLTGLSIIVKA
jgi:hypothetical protein